MKRCHPCLLLLAGLAIGLLCGSAITTAYSFAPKANYDQIVAQVGETNITRGQLAEHALAQVGQLQLGGELQNVAVIEELARMRNISVSADDVQKRIKEMCDYADIESPGASKQVLELTPWLLQERVRAHLLAERMMNFGISTTEIEQFYAGHPALYYRPEQVELICISVNDEASGKRVINRLKAGENPNQVAEQEASDPILRQQKGELGWFAREAFSNADAVDAIFNSHNGKGLQPKQFTGVINNTQINNGKPEYLIFYVKNRKAAYHPKLAEVHAQVAFVAREDKFSKQWPVWFRGQAQSLVWQQIEPSKLFDADAPLKITPLRIPKKPGEDDATGMIPE